MSEGYWATKGSKKIDEFGAKIKQTDSMEDRTANYRQWRWNSLTSSKCYTTDIDHVEWRIVDGKLAPVAFFELTRVDKNSVPNQLYLNSIIDRFTKRDGQAKMIKALAEPFNVPVYIIAFLKDLSTFCVYNLSHPKETKNNGWWILPQKKYKECLASLGSRAAISKAKSKKTS